MPKNTRIYSNAPHSNRVVAEIPQQHKARVAEHQQQQHDHDTWNGRHGQTRPEHVRVRPTDPTIVRPSHVVYSPDYVRLLAGVRGLEPVAFDLAIRNLVALLEDLAGSVRDHGLRQAYAKEAVLLAFTKHIAENLAQLMRSDASERQWAQHSRALGEKIIAHARAHRETVIPFAAQRHFVLLEIIRDDDKGHQRQAPTFTLRVYNTGLDPQKRHRKFDHNRIEVAWDVGGVRLGEGPHRLNARELQALLERCCVQGGLGYLYDWADSKRGCSTESSHHFRRKQKKQTGKDCASKALMASLRHHLTRPLYMRAKATLMRGALSALPAARRASAIRETACRQRVNMGSVRIDSDGSTWDPNEWHWVRIKSSLERKLATALS